MSTAGSPPLGVVFTDTSSPAGTADQWQWDFGDGGTSTAQHPVYTYTTAGVYTVTLTVTDTDTAETDTLVAASYVQVESPLQTTVITYEYDGFYRLTGAAYTGAISATYDYAYDSVGNMTAFTETVTSTRSVERTFDSANQLITSFDDGAGTTSYTYDGNGNLTIVYPPGSDAQNPVGALRYAYDQRNLMVSHETNPDGTAWVLQAAYVYDGANDRLQQVDHTGASPITTTYSNDVVGLTQVLLADDGASQVYNLFGLDLIQQEGGSEARTLLVDGLGSVRLELASVAVEAVTTYSPYGEVLEQNGTSGTVYGFTGEQEDEATGLLYLRARYYSNYLNRFLSADTIVPDFSNPQTLNLHIYVLNNPTNLTDPTGHDAWRCQDQYCRNSSYGYYFDPRDLTGWLFREMKANVNDPVVQSLRTKNLAGKGGIGLGASLIACGIWLDGPLPIVEAAGGAVALGGSVVYVDALLQFRAQVKNGARWDFKDEIGSKLGPGITLCTSAGCDPEIEYSVPGNIFFGYIGRASGFTGLELQAGAGWAEWTDPAHDKNSPEYSGPYPYGNVKDALEIGLSRPRLWRLGDEQRDHEAVTLGILLWDRFGANITLGQFKSMLGSTINNFAHPQRPASDPVSEDFAQMWPYPVGFFNNRGNVFIPSP